MSLLSLTDEQKQLFNLIEQSNGELTPEIELQVDELSFKIARKVDSFSFFLTRLKAEAKACKDQKDKFHKYQKAIENFTQRLKDNAKFVLEKHGQIDGELESLKLKNNPHSVEIIDQNKIPQKYFKLEPILDKTLLKEDLKKGDVPGARLIQKQSITFVRKK